MGIGMAAAPRAGRFSVAVRRGGGSLRGARTGMVRGAGGAGRRVAAADRALLFDCDGVIVLTEELHRLAYNAAFEAYGVEVGGAPLVWDVAYYDILQNTVGGGKPKMKWHFGQNGWPTAVAAEAGTTPAELASSEDAQNALVDALQDKKTEVYKRIVEEVAEARPGVIEMMDEALGMQGLAVGICSAATKAGFDKVINSVVGVERRGRFDVVMAGDDVPLKKPDPLIYNTARDKVDVPAHRCLVIEDSLVGLRAAKAAGMKCAITYTTSTADADFKGEGADLVLESLEGVTVADLFARVGL